MKSTYIVLTYTGTWLSKVIKVYKKQDYSHVSISLDENLKEMYSFGRYNPYIGFLGGFVHEGIDKGTFKRFKNTDTLILELSLNKSQYKRLKKTLKTIEEQRKMLGYNAIGLLLSAANIKITRNNKFYCTEFVRYLLDEIKFKHNLPKIVTPDDFRNIDNVNIIYEGKLKNYKNHSF